MRHDIDRAFTNQLDRVLEGWGFFRTIISMAPAPDMKELATGGCNCGADVSPAVVPPRRSTGIFERESADSAALLGRQCRISRHPSA